MTSTAEHAPRHSGVGLSPRSEGRPMTAVYSGSSDLADVKVVVNEDGYLTVSVRPTHTADDWSPVALKRRDPLYALPTRAQRDAYSELEVRLAERLTEPESPAAVDVQPIAEEVGPLTRDPHNDWPAETVDALQKAHNEGARRG